MRRKRVAVLISGRGSNMQALIAAAKAPDYPAEISLVLSNRPDAAGLETARGNGIAAVGLDHTAFDNRAAFDMAVAEVLGEHGTEIVACAGFMRIMTASLIARFAGAMINIHPSLLPLYRGLDTHQRALDDGVKVHGCTVHFVVPELDAGPIIAQAAVPVVAGDSADSLAARVLKAEHRIYPLALASVASGETVLTGERVHFSGETRDDQVILSPDFKSV